MTTKDHSQSHLSRSERVALMRSQILGLVPAHPTDLARVAAESLGIARQTAHHHIRALVDEGLLGAEGNTRARRYSLRTLADVKRTLSISPETEENQIWLDIAAPMLANEKDNLRGLWHYGFTEMVNNVIDHSDSPVMDIHILADALHFQMTITDFGVGVFKKIQNAFHLEDPRHALLELSKGKLTTDPERHTGEGVYFTSRAFDEFSILSGGLFYRRLMTREHGWLTEALDREEIPGTAISMKMDHVSDRQLDQVFASAATEADDYTFSRTHVPVSLARYGDEMLVSRSQAKRVLARFERFSEVMLDFEGVERIGQAFADEIFRVFQKANPLTRVIAVFTNPKIDRMIERVTASGEH